MPTRILSREGRLVAALDALDRSRSRSKEFPATVTERQPRDRRVTRRDSSKPVAVIATVRAISKGEGTRGAATSGGYYSGGGPGEGPGGGFGGGGSGEQN
jgi:hypothetical protein